LLSNCQTPEEIDSGSVFLYYTDKDNLKSRTKPIQLHSKF